MNIEDYSQEELDELEAQTDRIAANLRYIEEHEVYSENLEELEKQTSLIASNLKAIEDHQTE